MSPSQVIGELSDTPQFPSRHGTLFGGKTLVNAVLGDILGDLGSWTGGQVLALETGHNRWRGQREATPGEVPHPLGPKHTWLHPSTMVCGRGHKSVHQDREFGREQSPRQGNSETKSPGQDQSRLH